MQATRLHHREDPFDEPAPALAVAAEAAPSPQHGATQQALHIVVGRLNAFLGRERPQGRLQGQHVAAKLRHARIVAERSFQQRLGHAPLERFDQRLQLAPRELAFLKRMPRGEKFFDDSQPPAAHKFAGTAAIDNFLKIAFDFFFWTSLSAPNGLADGGVDELVASVFSFASSSRTCASNS